MKLMVGIISIVLIVVLMFFYGKKEISKIKAIKNMKVSSVVQETNSNVFLAGLAFLNILALVYFFVEFVALCGKIGTENAWDSMSHTIVLCAVSSIYTLIICAMSADINKNKKKLDSLEKGLDGIKETLNQNKNVSKGE